MKTCIRCRRQQPLQEFYLHRTSTDGRKGVCRSCQSTSAKEPQARAYQRKHRRTDSARYSKGKSEAKRRGFTWGLTPAQHALLLKEPCFYCHGPLDKTGVGLDRQDSIRGYEPNNVVSCCRACNRAKADYFTFEEMRDLIGPAIQEAMMARAAAEMLCA